MEKNEKKQAGGLLVRLIHKDSDNHGEGEEKTEERTEIFKERWESEWKLDMNV